MHHWALEDEQHIVSTTKTGLNVFPNPAFDNMTVQFSSDKKGEAMLNVYNLLGQKIYSSSFPALEGQNVATMDVNGFDKGAYILEVVNGNEVLRKEFIVVK